MSTLPHIAVAVLHGNDPEMGATATRLGDEFADISVTVTTASFSGLGEALALGDQIVLLDAELGDDVPTVDHIRAIRGAGSRVIVLSGIDSPQRVIQFMAAGADAALRKSDSVRRIADQVRLAANRSMLIKQRTSR